MTQPAADLYRCVAIACLAIATAVQAGCRPGQSPPPARGAAVEPQETAPRSSGAFDLAVKKSAAVSSADTTVDAPRFTDVHNEAGIEFVYDNGAVGRNLMVESIGGGVGWLDYDADGEPDLFLAQGGDPTRTANVAGLPDCLYRNLGYGQFVDVAALAGTSDPAYGQGVAVGDYDADGFDDLFVTNVGGNRLFRNMGDGTFEDVTEAAGVRGGKWSVSAAWGDLDGDGDLDLYVGNYLIYDVHNPHPCFTEDGKPAVCDPISLEACPNEVYFNRGDGSFSEEATERGLEPNDGNSKTLGVLIADLNNDGLVDVYVANDTTANYYFVNCGSGQFEESAIALGCAMNAVGAFQASMGIALGDYDRDGLPDLYLTHFTDDSNTLYRNLGPGGFGDVTRLVGLHLPTLDTLGFGTVMADFNRDGHEDLFLANGHIQELKNHDFAMRPQLFSYNGQRFVEQTAAAGDYFHGAYLGRGVAACDYDHDGDLDLLVVHQNAPAALLRNDADSGHWLKVQLIGSDGNRRAIGACITVRCGDQTLVRHIAGGGSFAATHESTALFEFARPAEQCAIDIRWPNGTRQSLKSSGIDRTIVVRQEYPAVANEAVAVVHQFPRTQETAP